MDTWTFIWLMFLLKIPIVALFLIVRWAVRQTPEPATGEDGGHRSARASAAPASPAPAPAAPPRRGPHGEPRVAVAAARAHVASRRRLAQR